MSAYVHIGDTPIIVLTFYDQDNSVLDISSATTKQIWLSDPDGNKVEKTGTFYTDGTDGKLQYTCLTTDIDETGIWKAQGYVVLTSGTFHTTVESFPVKANL